MASLEHGIVEYFSRNNGNSCGYCKSSNSSSHGLWAHSLTVHEYQSLIDRGWRRSGHYCYKPVMNETCCPSYTIKCDALQFKMTRSQKKLLKKFNHFLKTGEKMKGPSNVKHEDRNVTTDIPNELIQNCIPSSILGSMEEESITDTNEPLSFQLECETKLMASEESHTKSNPSTSSGEPKHVKRPVTIVPPKVSSESSKSKHLRIERRKQTLLSRGLTPDEVQATMQASKVRRMTSEKSLEDLIQVQAPCSSKHRLEIKLVGVKSREFARTAKLSGTLFAKYQTTVHRESADESNFSSFKGFLIDSPLNKASKSETEPEGPGYGSFHQQYWLDERLIAVGVIDILPRCVSSVYFFYDPDYAWLSLGTLSSLREIEFTRSLQRSLPELRSYYMGFYIHSCAKMRYKGNLRPSYLLCPEVYSWHPIQEARQLLDEMKYARLNPDPGARDEQGDVNLDEVQVLTGGKVMLYRQFKQMYDHDEEHPMVQEYALLVGQYCAYRLWLVQ